MEREQEFDVQDFTQKIIEANQRIAKNYLKNLSGYHHDSRDIGLTWLNFATKMSVNPQELFKISSFCLDFFKTQQELFHETFFSCNQINRLPVLASKEDRLNEMTVDFEAQ